jgi:hypothetical protein
MVVSFPRHTRRRPRQPHPPHAHQALPHRQFIGEKIAMKTFIITLSTIIACLTLSAQETQPARGGGLAERK